MSGSGISWAICKSAPRSRQITMPAPHHSVFYRLNALLSTQPTSSKHWRQTTTSTKPGQIKLCMSVHSYQYPYFLFNGFFKLTFGLMLDCSKTVVACMINSWLISALHGGRVGPSATAHTCYMYYVTQWKILRRGSSLSWDCLATRQWLETFHQCSCHMVVCRDVKASRPMWPRGQIIRPQPRPHFLASASILASWHLALAS